MEPKVSSPNFGPEQSPAEYGQNTERAPQLPNPETGVERGHEKFEQRGETTPVVAAPILPPPVVVPEPQITPNDATVAPAGDDTPLVANDDDLIEKEWVDKAKKIIIQTKDDPYRREQEVGKLQADYLRKRYGRELGASQ